MPARAAGASGRMPEIIGPSGVSTPLIPSVPCCATPVASSWRGDAHRDVDRHRVRVATPVDVPEHDAGDRARRVDQRAADDCRCRSPRRSRAARSWSVRGRCATIASFGRGHASAHPRRCRAAVPGAEQPHRGSGRRARDPQAARPGRSASPSDVEQHEIGARGRDRRPGQCDLGRRRSRSATFVGVPTTRVLVSSCAPWRTHTPATASGALVVACDNGDDRGPRRASVSATLAARVAWRHAATGAESGARVRSNEPVRARTPMVRRAPAAPAISGAQPHEGTVAGRGGDRGRRSGGDERGAERRQLRRVEPHPVERVGERRPPVRRLIVDSSGSWSMCSAMLSAWPSGCPSGGSSSCPLPGPIVERVYRRRPAGRGPRAGVRPGSFRRLFAVPRPIPDARDWVALTDETLPTTLRSQWATVPVGRRGRDLRRRRPRSRRGSSRRRGDDLRGLRRTRRAGADGDRGRDPAPLARR